MDWIEVQGFARLVREEGKWTSRIDLQTARPSATPTDPYLYAFGAKPVNP
jgi:hypothetical protein